MREESNNFELLKTIMHITKTVIPAISEALYKKKQTITFTISL